MGSHVSVAEHRVLKCLFTEKETAEYLRVQAQTLRIWRVRGVGPTFVRLKRGLIRYRQTDLDAFVEAGLRTSTSQTATQPEPAPA